MGWNIEWKVLADFASAIGGIAAAVAAYFAFRSVSAARQQAVLLEQQLQLEHRFRKVELHARLLSGARTIQGTFPPEVNDPHWQPSAQDKRGIMMFWYHVFDEWAICKRDATDLTELWDRYYSKGVISAMKRPQFQDGLRQLLNTSELFGAAREFSDEMNALCLAATQKPFGAAP